MTELNEIINDLNITIADVETFGCSLTIPRGMTTEQYKSLNDGFKRVIGQLKAARSSLINCNRMIEVTQVSQVGGGK